LGRRGVGIPLLPQPARRHARLAGFLFEIVDRLLAVLHFLLHAVELGERFLAVRLDRFHHRHAGIMTRRDYTVVMPSKEEVLEALSQVEDPELGMDVVDLGLVYEVEVEGPKAKVLYSLTSMGCPAGPLIAGDMERVTLEVPGVEEVELELTFDPPWTPDRMSEDAKFILGIG